MSKKVEFIGTFYLYIDELPCVKIENLASLDEHFRVNLRRVELCAAYEVITLLTVYDDFQRLSYLILLNICAYLLLNAHQLAETCLLHFIGDIVLVFVRTWPT